MIQTTGSIGASIAAAKRGHEGGVMDITNPDGGLIARDNLLLLCIEPGARAGVTGS